MASSSRSGWLALLGSFLGSCLGVVLILVISFSFLVGGISSLFEELLEDQHKVVDGGQILEINLNKPIVELAEISPLDEIDLPFAFAESKIGLNQIRHAFEKAIDDDNVKGVLLKIDNPDCGYAKLNEIKSYIEEFKTESEKPVYVYGESMTEKGYYLATSANKIYLTPAGMLEFKGLRTELMFFKGLFEKLELEPIVFRVGKFKSAVEPFILDKMSDENREQVRSFLEDILTYNLSEIGQDRAVPQNKLREINDQLLVRNIHSAVEYGLIDGAKYYDEVFDLMCEETEVNNTSDVLTFLKYSEPNFEEILEDAQVVSNEDKIVVLVAEGEIASGKSVKDEKIGSISFNNQLRKAVEDSSVKAIVLRINSPGGSALASDVMWREIKQASKAKPIICSMSDVAASGGYYMAMACDHIFAQSNTITGSIGVFGLSVELDDFLKKKLGITTDRVTTGEFSDLGSPLREMSEKEYEIIQHEVERIYVDFTTKAAASRNMSLEQLQEVASGRVWSGVRATQLGLVDEIGGVNDAILYAAEQAGISDYEIEFVPKNENIFSQWTENIEASMSGDNLVKKNLTHGEEWLEMIEYLNSMDVIQARLPVDINIE